MPNQALLVQTLVGLADNLVDDFDVIDLLTLLADRCVEIVDVATAGVMLAVPGAQLQVIASSSEAMRILELFELEANEGPCLDCYRTGTPIVNLELSAVDGRWPRFTRRAIDDGFESVHSMPMRLRGRTIGALNMFRTGTGALDDADVVAAQALADVATIAIVQHRAALDARALNDQLNQVHNSRMIVEQAKGRITQATGVDMEQAFRRLRNHARNHNLHLAELARGIAEGTADPGTLDRLRRHRN
jgi:GAF domain-containing protein